MKPPLPYPLLTQCPETMNNSIVFAGTRVPVQALIDYLVPENLIEEFLSDFPSVSRELATAVREILEQCDARALSPQEGRDGLRFTPDMPAGERLEVAFRMAEGEHAKIGSALGVDQATALVLRQRWRQAGRRPSKCMSELIG